MRSLLTAVACAFGGIIVSAAPTLPVVVPTNGMVIERSVRLKPGRYRMNETAAGVAITVRGRAITVDFTGVTIVGSEADPDQLTGTGLEIDASPGVTIRGGTIRGYKVALLARHSPHLHITGADYSYNWRPRLWSGIERESLVDWLTYHHNEQDEWLRYGAGLYLADCANAEIDHTRATHNQNGLLVTRSAGLKIWNDTFSWNSGLGIGFYRTTDSLVVDNWLDWNVRGYSHGFYNRGQDSAALLMFEQSSRNRVARNSMTHSGDGVFLWAGQSTMDTGEGGANDNVFVGNDVSHSVANGIEATFSRNTFIGNRIEDNWHGIWGGYSFNSLIQGNTFAHNTDAIAIEHGQHNRITDNRFDGDETAIRLWANASQDSNFAYAKARDTESHDYTVEANTFANEKTAVNVLRTSDVRTTRNRFTNVATPIQELDVRGVLFERPGASLGTANVPVVPRMPGALSALPSAGTKPGRDAIIIDEWGPYDFQYPILWPVGSPSGTSVKFRILGPPGRWRFEHSSGEVPLTDSRVVPGELTVTRDPGRAGGDLRLMYIGADVVLPLGERVAGGNPIPIGDSFFDPVFDWQVKYWAFDELHDPVAHPDVFAELLRTAPIKSTTASHLDVVTSGPIAAGLPRSNVAMVAEGTADFGLGAILTTVSDDGLRVWVDEKLVIDRWSVHESTVDWTQIRSGRHQIRIEYFQATGWAELTLRFKEWW